MCFFRNVYDVNKNGAMQGNEDGESESKEKVEGN